MATYDEMIKSSGCFGLAYDGTVKECNLCEVRVKCEAKCRLGQASKPMNIPVLDPKEVNTIDTVKSADTVPVVTATTKKPKTVNKPPRKKEAEKPPIQYASDMPEFKNYSVEELENLAKERGCDLTGFEKYIVPNIRRMRLTMAIKKTYEIA